MSPIEPVLNMPARLTEERQRLALSQDRVAGGIGVSRSTLMRLEQGVRVLDALQLVGLDRLGFDVGYVLTGKRHIYREESPAELGLFLQHWAVERPDVARDLVKELRAAPDGGGLVYLRRHRPRADSSAGAPGSGSPCRGSR